MYLLNFSDDEGVLQASNILRARYTKNRFIQSVDDWPPYRPKHYTPLTIVHHGLMRTESEVEVVAQELSGPDVWTGTHSSEIYNRAINNINDLFMTYENNEILHVLPTRFSSRVHLG